MIPIADGRVLLAAALLLASTAAARPLGPDGFITSWRLEPTGRVIAQPGPEMRLKEVLPRRLLRRRARMTLSTGLQASREGRARFKIGCTARCELLLDGRSLATLDPEYGVWLDDHEVEATLTAGAHRLEVRITRQRSGRRAPQDLVLRVHDERNAVPDWLTLALEGEQPAEVLVRSLPVEWHQRATAEGWEVRAKVGPAAPTGATLAVALGDAPPVEMTGEAVDLRTIAAGPVTRLTVRQGDEVLRTEEVRHTLDARAMAAIVRARRVLSQSPPVEPLVEARDTLEWGAGHLEGLLARADRDKAFITDRAAVLDRQATAIADGRDPLADERGPVLRAYRSPLDGRLQVYALYVPPSWRPKRELPLVVALHPSGFHALLALRIALGYPPRKGRSKRYETRHLPPIRDPRAVVVAPYGYRGTGSRYFGKVDVLDVIERVQRRYGTEPRRVTLSGGSLGGLGTWHIGLRLPDRFNAIMPVAGYGSVRHYPTVRGLPRTDWEPFLIERRDNVTFVENARHLPMRCVHGAKDNPARSKIIVDQYRRFGYPHEYIELEDVGHNAWDDAYEGGQVFRLARRHRTPDRPAEVRFVSGSYRHRSAYWATIEQFERHDALGRVRARQRRTGVEASTENVRRLTLDLGSEAVPVTLDGQRLPPRAGEVTFAREGGAWILARDRAPPAGEKRPGASGPIDDIRYEPHLFVYGTADATQTETNRRRAEHAARYWWNSAEIHVPVLPDSAVTGADIASHHLVLLGNPRSNHVLARIADRLPVRWTEEAVVLGDQRFAGSSVGVSFIHPNPLTSGRTYVLVHAGVTHRGTWLSAWLPRWLPDYVVYDEGISVQRGGRLMDRRRPLAGGYFDRRWRLPAGG